MVSPPQAAATRGDPASAGGSTTTLSTLQDSTTLEPQARQHSAQPDEEGDASDKPQYADITTAAEARHSASLHRLRSASTVRSNQEHRDPELELNLPYRTLTAEANMDEYRVETAAGEIPGPPKEGEPNKNYRLVTFEPNDPENPKNWSVAMKWYCTMVVAMTCFVVAFNSSVITADMEGVAEEFGQSVQLTLASTSLFVMGFGIGKSPVQNSHGLGPELTSRVQGRWSLRPFPRSTDGGSSSTSNVFISLSPLPRSSTNLAQRIYPVLRRHLHYSLRGGKEYTDAAGLPRNRWHRLLGPNDPGRRYARRSLA